MSQSPDSAKPGTQDGAGDTPVQDGAPAQERSVTRDNGHLTSKVEDRRLEVEILKAQISVLRAECKPSAQRQASVAWGADNGESDRGVASFVLSSRMHRRHNTTGVHRRNNLREPILELYSKTAARAFAEQHGVRVPAVFGSWPTPDAVEWDSLPERFVIKSSRGGGGVNVFPLERRGDDFFDFIASEMVTQEAVTASFWKKHQEGSVYFAEELLMGRGNTELPHDIKVFCFYGDPAYIEVRAEDWSRSKGTVQRVRTFLPDGTELFNVRALIPRGDDIGRPHDFPAIAEASSRLSAAIRRPIQRIDFYETDRGIVFGEITQNPGRPPALVPSWDRRLGDTYEDATARLFTDLAAEGHLDLVHGQGDLGRPLGGGRR